MHIRFRSLLTTALVAAALMPLHASSPKFFQAATQNDFLKGDVENLSIDNHGQLTLGPVTELVYETSAPFLWSMVAAPDDTLFIGTGNEGKVFRVDPQGKGSLFFDSPELEAHALALAPNGGLYVGTSPDGKIYRVERNGTSTTFFNSEDKYIWALAVDGKGNVYAGTGDKGVIHKITPDGKATVFYKTNTTHVTALAFDKNGNLLAGTGTPGLQGVADRSRRKPFVLLDSPFQEIHALRLVRRQGHALRVAAISGRRRSGAAPVVTDSGADRVTGGEVVRAPIASVSAEITSMSIVDTGGSGSQASPREDRRSSKGAVYRISPDGVWDQLWESKEDSPYDLTFDRNGALIIGTGGKGKLYRLEGDPIRPTLLARAAAQQVTAFYKDWTGRLYYATANPGKLFRISPERAARGTYESEVHDAQMISTWGAISWHGTAAPGSKVELFTRAGNTETPDDTWSTWSAAYGDAAGSPITSPKARYLQWRVVLTGKGDGPVRPWRPPPLRSGTCAAGARHYRASAGHRVPEAVHHRDQARRLRRQSTPERNSRAAAARYRVLRRRSAAAPIRRLQTGLKADDENDDDLVYDVLFRREGEATWKTLRKATADSILVWDTTTAPNGTYFVRIVASDAPSNPLGSALTGELDSVAFEIDNTPPTITVGTVRVERGRTIIPFDVKDDHSPVQRVEFSQDGQRWRGVFPWTGSPTRGRTASWPSTASSAAVTWRTAPTIR
jgi:WD40 repeat protein